MEGRRPSKPGLEPTLRKRRKKKRLWSSRKEVPTPSRRGARIWAPGRLLEKSCLSGPSWRMVKFGRGSVKRTVKESMGKFITLYILERKYSKFWLETDGVACMANIMVHLMNIGLKYVYVVFA